MQKLSLQAAEKVTGGLELACSCSSPAHALRNTARGEGILAKLGRRVCRPDFTFHRLPPSLLATGRLRSCSPEARVPV